MSVFTINKRGVNSVKDAVLGFTEELQGLSDKAKKEFDVLQEKVDNQYVD